MSSNSLSMIFPERVSIHHVRMAVDDLPLVPKDRDGQIGTLAFSPQENIDQIYIDTSRVQVITAEAAAVLLAFIDWMKKLAPNIHIQTSKDDFISPFRVNKISESKKTSRFLIEPRRIHLPNLAKLDKDRGSEMSALVKNAKLLLSQVMDDIDVEPNIAVSDWLYEVLIEGLLNVAQHSATSLETDDLFAYVAISISSSTILEKMLQDISLENIERSESDWLHRKALLPSTKILEVAIVDVGHGIPQSLATSYLRDNPEAITKLNGYQGGKRRRLLHNDVLLWAMTPFGTRKSSVDFGRALHFDSWRGLFRLLYRTDRMSGILTVTSGSGYLGSATLEETGEQVLVRPEMKGRGVPWTSIRGVISLPQTKVQSKTINVTQSIKHDSRPLTLPIERVVKILLPIEINQICENNLNSYSEKIRSAILSSKTLYNMDVTPSLGTVYWGLVHQSLPTNVNNDADLSNTTNWKTDMPDRLVFLWRLLLDLMMPGSVYIHFFLSSKITDDDLDRLQEYFYAHAETKDENNLDAHFGMQAIVLPHSRRLKWIYSVRDPKKNHLVRPINASEVKKREIQWTKYLSYIPHALDKNKLATHISLETHNLICTKYLSALISTERSNIGQPIGLKWYWKAREEPNGQPLQAVRTQGNSYSYEYLSILGLCKVNFDFEIALAANFAEWLNKVGKVYSDIVVVPDNDSSSYLVMRRLESHVLRIMDSTKKNKNAISFLHPSKLTFSGDTVPHIVVFADFRFAGTTINKRITMIQDQRPEINTKDFSCYICVDGSIKKGTARNIGNIGNFAQYEDVRSISLKQNPKIEILAVDPVSNELIPFNQTKNMDKYWSLAWHNGEEFNEELISDSIFQYGLQHQGGRYMMCRWPVHIHLANELILSRIASIILDEISVAQRDGIYECCVAIRSNSTLASISENLVQMLKKEILKRSDIASNTCIWFAKIETRRYGGQRLTSNSLLAAIRSAHPVHGDASERQPTLFGDSSSLGLEREFSLLFLDNSAVTGRTISELLVAATTLEAPFGGRIALITLFPIVTRLNPTEESLFSQIHLSQMKDISNRRLLQVRFKSLVQLRMRSYKTVGEIPLIQHIEKILKASRDESHSWIVEFKQGMQGTLNNLYNLEKNFNKEIEIIRGPFDLISSKFRDVKISHDAIRFRSLISLRQQGYPCTQLILEKFRDITALQDESLLEIFSLEPDLLKDDALLLDLGSDIADYATQLLINAGSTEKIAFSMWVLSLLPRSFDKLLAHIVHSEFMVKFKLQLFTFLALYSLDDVNKRLVLERAINYLTDYSSESNDVSQTIQLLRASYDFLDDPVHNMDLLEAHQVVKNYLRDATFKHGIDEAAHWLRLRETARVIERKDSNQNSSIINLIDNATVIGAKKWITKGLLPLFSAVLTLCRHYSLDSDIQTMVRTKSEELRRSFLAFEIELSDCQSRSKPVNQIRDMWGQIEKCSSSKCSSEIFANPVKCFPNIMDLSRLGLDKVPFLEKLLPNLVNDPLAIIWGTLAKIIQSNTSIQANVNIDGYQYREEILAAYIDNAVFLDKYWFRKGVMPILLGNDIHHFQEAIQVIIENIVFHNSRNQKVKWGMRGVKNLTTIELSIWFESELSTKQGHGQGIPKIKKLISKMNGVVTEFKNNIYRIEIKFSSEFIVLKGDSA